MTRISNSPSLWPVLWSALPFVTLRQVIPILIWGEYPIAVFSILPSLFRGEATRVAKWKLNLCGRNLNFASPRAVASRPNQGPQYFDLCAHRERGPGHLRRENFQGFTGGGHLYHGPTFSQGVFGERAPIASLPGDLQPRSIITAEPSPAAVKIWPRGFSKPAINT